MDVWTFLWLMLALKIPVVGLFLIVRWAAQPACEPAAGQDGGIGPAPRPRHPHHPRSRPPRSPRRGPHGDPAPASPPRVRALAQAHRRPRV